MKFPDGTSVDPLPITRKELYYLGKFCEFGECENLKELVIEGDMLWANGHPCMFSHCPNLTIYGPTNSSIQVHAKQEKISFVEI